MSRSKLANAELRWYTSSGGTETTKVKLVPTNDVLTVQGSTAGTRVKLTNLADPTANTDGATKSYVDTQIQSNIQGLKWKSPCAAKSTADLGGTFSSNTITAGANGPFTVDGIQLALSDRVLVANQTTQSQNGLYLVTTAGDVRVGQEAPAVLSCATDGDTAAELHAAAVFIERGTVGADTAYIQTTDSITLNTSNVVWQQFASAGQLVGGDGISRVGNTLTADVDNTSVEISGGKIAVKTDGVGTDAIAPLSVTGAEIANGTITSGKLAADSCTTTQVQNLAITTAKLATASVTTSTIADDAVDADKIAANAVGQTAISANAIQTSHLSTGCVDSDAIGAAQVLSAAIAGNAVLTSHIGAGQVQNTNILDNSCTANKLASNSCVSSKIPSNNILETHHVSGGVSERALASNSVSQAKMKASSVGTSQLIAGSVTNSVLANNSVTGSKLGTLSSLVVNGMVTATSFLASGSGSETDGGFALPKSKSLSIDFNSDQTITGDGNFHTVGGAVSGAGVNFTYDDNITMCLAMSAFRINHAGTRNTEVGANYEVAYYNASQVQQAFNDLSGNISDFQLYTPASIGNQDFQLSHFGVVGDGTARIASIRLRMKHTEAADTVKVTDSIQVTAIAVDDTSGNTNKTYANGVLT
jgi:hypothetical protein